MNLSTRKLAVSSVMAALIFIITFTVKIPVFSQGAYVNLGDTIIYLTSFILGGVPALFAAGIGSLLADIAGGAVVYAPATLIIKAAMGLLGGYMTLRPSFFRFTLAAIVCGAIMVAGYGLFEYFTFGAAYAIGSLPFNLIQWGGGAGIAIALYKPALKIRSTFHFRREK